MYVARAPVSQSHEEHIARKGMLWHLPADALR